MATRLLADTLTVVNGPEDGTEFSIVRAPFTIGRDTQCLVLLRLDNHVPAVLAEASAVENGYRIRRAARGVVTVDAKRAGAIRSQVLRSGGCLRVGTTDLVLQCAPDGLASRSRGVVMASDGVHFLTQGLAGAWGVFSFAPRLGKGLGRALRFVLKHWKMTAIAVLVLLYLFHPPFHNFVLGWIQRIPDLIRGQMDRVGG